MAPEPLRRRSHAGLIAVIIVLVLAVVAGAGILFYLHAQQETEDEAYEVAYGSEGALVISTETVMAAYDLDGEALEEFTVHIEVEDVDAELGWNSASVTVSGTNEFTMAAFTNIEPGTYSMSIENEGDGQTYRCIDLTVVEGDEASPTAIPARVAFIADPDDPQSAVEPAVSYTSTQVTAQVSVTFRSSSGDTAYDEEWTYPQFASSAENAALDALNLELEDAFNELLEETKSWSSDSGSSICLSYRAELVYLEDGLASVRTEVHELDAEGNASTTVTGALYDLEDGAKITPESACDLTSTELRTAATEAIEAYLASNPSTRSTSELESTIDSLVRLTARYYLASEGLVVIVQAGELESDEASGHEIVVVPSETDEAADAGTDVHDAYAAG